MIRIAACDDKKENLDELCGYLELYFKENGKEEAEICRFQEGKALLAAIEILPFDVYFLDVLMPDLNGLDIGRRIRREDQRAMIVYITVSREFAFEAFGVRAFHYLEKPVKREELFDILEALTNRGNHRSLEKISIRTRNGQVSISLPDIMYVENIFRCSVYMLSNGRQVSSLCNRSSFEESVGLICQHPEFVQPHKSYFVNMNYIQALEAKNLTLDNGMQIAISRKRMAETKRAYLEFLVKGGSVE